MIRGWGLNDLPSEAHSRLPTGPRCLRQSCSVVTHVHRKTPFCLVCPLLIKLSSIALSHVVQALLL